MAKALYEEQHQLAGKARNTNCNEPTSTKSNAHSYINKANSGINASDPNPALSVLRIWLSYKTPFLIQNEIFKICGIESGSKQAKIKRELIKQSFIVDHILQIGKARASVWEPTQKAYETLNIQMPKHHSKGGWLHQFLAHRISERAKEKDYTAAIEFYLSNNKAVDVVLRKPDNLIFIEIAISEPLEKEISNIIMDLETDLFPNKLILAVQNSKMRKKLEKLIADNSQLPKYKELITIELAGNLISQKPRSKK
jgi:hypothetical protein